MAVLTENELRKFFRNRNFKDDPIIYEAPEGTILTPSAKSFLVENHIQLRYEAASQKFEEQSLTARNVEKQQPKEKEQITEAADQLQSVNARYETIFGGFLDTKPEHMTHLYGNMLVFKDHPRIYLRGKVDSLESQIMEVQICCSKAKRDKLVEDLEEILLFVRQIMRNEVLNKPMEDFLVLGMTPADLREQSHYPKKYFGMNHFQPSYEMGEMVIVINSLRTRTRETELAAYQAFKKAHGGVEREDLIRALNRLSSLFWIIMFRIRTGYYNS
jgi:ethanolamine utilization cobalamin adenosyltransferase